MILHKEKTWKKYYKEITVTSFTERSFCCSKEYKSSFLSFSFFLFLSFSPTVVLCLSVSYCLKNRSPLWEKIPFWKLYQSPFSFLNLRFVCPVDFAVSIVLWIIRIRLMLFWLLYVKNMCWYSGIQRRGIIGPFNIFYLCFFLFWCYFFLIHACPCISVTAILSFLLTFLYICVQVLMRVVICLSMYSFVCLYIYLIIQMCLD